MHPRKERVADPGPPHHQRTQAVQRRVLLAPGHELGQPRPPPPGRHQRPRHPGHGHPHGGRVCVPGVREPALAAVTSVLDDEVQRPGVVRRGGPLVVEEEEASVEGDGGFERGQPDRPRLPEAVQKVVVGVRHRRRCREQIQKVFAGKQQDTGLPDPLIDADGRGGEVLGLGREVMADGRGGGVAGVALVNHQRTVRNRVAGPADAGVFVLDGVVVRIEEAAGAVERDGELVAVVVAVALAEQLDDDGGVAGPGVGRLVGPEDGQAVRRPHL
ncbi:MAG: hypothetical protein BWZ02_02322 [Lentisphaerae bacterium ADurb.BinA184]|nr:MAG: hypothetical protein BWZ02_02322 [Lentisphaerae bacterium ADurb.BinA184]